MAIPRDITAKRSIVYYIGRALAMVGVVSMAWAGFYGAQLAYDMNTANEESHYWRSHYDDDPPASGPPPREPMMTEQKAGDLWVLAQLSWASFAAGGLLMFVGGGRLMPQRMEKDPSGSMVLSNPMSQ